MLTRQGTGSDEGCQSVIMAVVILTIHYSGKYYHLILKKSGVIDDIKAQWGTLDEFKNEFANKATTLFGSGWTWLVVNDGKLEIVTTPNQDNPLTEGKNTNLTI